MKNLSALTVIAFLLNIVAWGQNGKVVNAANFSGEDCGSKINAAEAALGAEAGEIIVTEACGTSKWSPVVISHDHHVVAFKAEGPYSITTITLAANSGQLLGPATLKQVANGNAHEIAILVKGNDNRVQNLTCDGSASHGVVPNGTDDGCFQVYGSRNSILNNTVTASQGDGVTIAGIGANGVCASVANDNIVQFNKISNANIAKPSSGIVAGNNNSTAGPCISNTLIKDNQISATSGNCIYATGDIATAKLPSKGTQITNTQIRHNTVSDCGDSPIEASDMAINTLIQGNDVDCSRNACILTRDAVGTQIFKNTVKMESSALQFGISVGPPVFQPSSMDTKAVVSENVIRGYFPHAAISVTQHGANVTNNDIEETSRSVGADGSGLGGEGIACGGDGVSCSASGNEIKHVRIGIDLNPGAVPHSSQNLEARGNRISQVDTGINLYELKCANCNFSSNTFTQIRTVAIQDNGANANGTGTSVAAGNTYNLGGWAGASPKNTVRNLPNYRQ
jgi:hypothetical protein